MEEEDQQEEDDDAEEEDDDESGVQKVRERGLWRMKVQETGGRGAV